MMNKKIFFSTFFFFWLVVVLPTVAKVITFDISPEMQKDIKNSCSDRYLTVVHVEPIAIQHNKFIAFVPLTFQSKGKEYPGIATLHKTKLGWKLVGSAHQWRVERNNPGSRKQLQEAGYFSGY